MKYAPKLLLTAALTLAGHLGAQVPNIINYQGRVSVNGVNFDGTGQFKFALINGSNQTYWNTDGTTQSSEPVFPISVTVTKGLYSVGLGDTSIQFMSALPANVFGNTDVRLRVWFSDGTGFQQLTPDQRIFAVGYALNAASADTVADGAITSAKIAAGTIQQSHLAAGVGGGGTVADGDITTAKLADSAVASAKLADGAVTSAKIVDGGIAAADLGAGSVTGTQIANNSVAAGHLNLAGLTTTLWQASGNSGTVAGTQFLGTTDNQPLELRINNGRALRLNPGVSAGEPNLVVGGLLNATDANVEGVTIAGGEGNAVADGASFTFLGGGQSNVVSTNASRSVLAGGVSNLVVGGVSVIGGGFNNVAGGFESVVGGGEGNVAGGGGAFVGGGVTNTATGGDSVVVGGGLNLASGLYSFIGAGVFNGATNVGSIVLGGSSNVVWGVDASIGGGSSNFIHTNATIAVISGGLLNAVTNYGGAVVGGSANVAGGFESIVGGGEANLASGTISVVGGGYFNGATGYGSVVPGGYANLASGTNSWAGGAFAAATNNGAFVWSDNSSANVFGSTIDNQFNVRATGGARFISNAAGTSGVSLSAGGGSWDMLSDRNAKENFAEVDPEEVLGKVAGLPVTTWNYRSQDTVVRHMGPMAQDFRAAFGLGNTDRRITTSDLHGVALAAIKGLNQKLEARDERIRELEDRLANIEALLPRQAD